MICKFQLLGYYLVELLFCPSMNYVWILQWRPFIIQIHLNNEFLFGLWYATANSGIRGFISPCEHVLPNFIQHRLSYLWNVIFHLSDLCVFQKIHNTSSHQKRLQKSQKVSHSSRDDWYERDDIGASKYYPSLKLHQIQDHPRHTKTL